MILVYHLILSTSKVDFNLIISLTAHCPLVALLAFAWELLLMCYCGSLSFPPNEKKGASPCINLKSSSLRLGRPFGDRTQ